ncbi:DUF397 domain-containing protein [Streptomyces sp. B21-083]|uniref:DUF397 domain-containing protein n=1 Tax=Streptomyces sp. B21-083 TaxID=3039410 RepID=UPI002FF1FB63
MSSERTTWFTSSYSGQNGECIEARSQVAGIDVRDSKSSRGPVVRVGAAAWALFLGGVYSGFVPLGS